MLSAIHHRSVEGYRGGQRWIVYLVTTVERLVASGADCIFSDGNAATWKTRFFDDLDHLDEAVDWEVVNARTWKSLDDPDRDRRRQAEFLVHQRVPLRLIEGLVAKDQAVRDRVAAIVAEADVTLPVTVRPAWYF